MIFEKQIDYDLRNVKIPSFYYGQVLHIYLNSLRYIIDHYLFLLFIQFYSLLNIWCL